MNQEDPTVEAAVPEPEPESKPQNTLVDEVRNPEEEQG